MGKINKTIGFIGTVVAIVGTVAAIIKANSNSTQNCDDPFDPENLAKMSREELEIKREEVRLNNQLYNWRQLLNIIDKEITKRDYPNADQEEYIYPKKNNWYFTSDD